jgi:transmembrane sensor
MDFSKYISFTTEDFILDADFTEWVQNPGKGSDAFWAEFLSRHPEKQSTFEEAAFIIKGFLTVEEDVPEEKLEQILGRLQSGTIKRRGIRISGILKYAAVFTGVIGIGAAIYFYQSKQRSFPLVAVNTEEIAKGRIILSDGSSVEFSQQETEIRQTATGELLINSDTVNQAVKARKSEESALIRVIIPYGKRTQVTLPDGSRIWLNSGSQLSYPPGFSGKSREVYLSGEAFFDVAKNAEKPFYVITKDIKIRVLGTRFNVFAYEDEESVQAVLLEGKVTIGKNTVLARTEEMEPGERSVYNKFEGTFTKGKADVSYFTSWLYGYLIFENEPTPEIFRKLERYYNQPIIVEEGLRDITFSGKLDLKDNLEDVLQSITYSSRVKITREGDTYKVNR